MADDFNKRLRDLTAGVYTPDVDYGYFMPNGYRFNTPPSHAAADAPPAQVYAEGGDVGEGRFTRTPEERRIVRERSLDMHRPEHSEEWLRFINHPQGPLGYGMEALSRLDNGAGAASQGENNIYDAGKMARGVAELAAPNHELGDKYGLPGEFADALQTTANVIPGLGPMQKGLSQLASPITRTLMHAPDALERIYGWKQGYADGGSVMEKLLGKIRPHTSRVMPADIRSQFRDLHTPDNDNMSRQGYQAVRDSLERFGSPADLMYQNEANEQFRRSLAAPRLVDGYADGGKVSKIIKAVTNKFGSFQGSRMQRAADETNLERIHPEGLKRMFDPGQSGLYMNMPPGDFQDYAARISKDTADDVPYVRFENVPGHQKLLAGEMDQDWYLANLAKLGNTRGFYSSPELHVTKNNAGLTSVSEHEGRHRMMAMDRLGDPRALVQLPNDSMRSLNPEERVDYLTQKYFPHGKGQLVVPEGYDSTSPKLVHPKGPGPFDNASLLDYTPRTPLPIMSEPYAGGGKVLSLIERLAEGKPKVVKLPGGETMPAHPIKEFEDVADHFATRYGNKYPIDSFPKFDEDRARKIAEAYEQMKHDPSDPRVKRAYDALISETMDQYKALEGTGAKFEFLKPGEMTNTGHGTYEGDPYAASPALGYKDLVQNGRLKVFPTEQGFGTQTDITDSPMLKRVGRVGDLDNATANDAFRVVHDALGHFGPGNPFFRAAGEERAWNAHARSYSPDALPAATTETRGQNSWVNYGPRSLENKGASGADTIYADQKAGLLPDWAYKTDDTPKFREGGDVALKLAKKFLKEPKRVSFPGIYKDPDVLLDEAKQRLVADPGKEGPMYKLFGHTRDSLDDLAQGNRDLDSIQPLLGQRHPFNLSGTADVSPQVLTNKNAGRLTDMLGEALRDPQMKNTRSWYEMSPLWQRATELGVGDKGMRDLNNRMAVMSAGSDPRTEINRGFHVNWLAKNGRLEDFIKYGGTPEDARGDWFPHDLADLKGHAYHDTAHVPNLLDNEMTGQLWPAKHKVPTYAAATDPRDPYSARPIADSHFNRILGYPDVSTAATEAVRQGVPSNTQYSDLVPWFNKNVADKTDLRPRDAQALLWNLGGPQTGVRYIGPSKLEMISDYMNETAGKLGVHPEEARDMLLRGEIGGAASNKAPFARGGQVDDDLNLFQSQFYAKGGNVVPLKSRVDDDLNLFQSQNYRRGGFFRR